MSSELCHAVEPEKEVSLSGPALKDLLESFVGNGQACRILANGSSMTPSIRDGDLVTIEPVSGEVRPGDVVAASDACGGRVLIHRVAKARHSAGGAEYLLQGDNGCSGDDWVAEDCILGGASEVSRGGRRVMLLSGLSGLIASWCIQRACRCRRLLSHPHDLACS